MKRKGLPTPKLLKSIWTNRFIRNVGIYTVSDVLNKAVPFVLLPVLTRYLTPSDYGIIAMFTVFTSILGVFISLETHAAISVKFFKSAREELKIYIANVFFLVLGTTSLVFIVILFFHSYIYQFTALPLEWMIIGVFVTLFTLFNTVNLVLWQSEHKAINLGVFQISQTVFNLGLSLILVIDLEMGWEGRLLAASAAAILFGMCSVVLIYRRNYLNFVLSRSHLKEIISFGLPLLPHALGTWVRTGVDRIFLTVLISTAATGLYTVGFQIASIIMVLIAAFNRAYTPFLFEKLKDISSSEKIKIVRYTYLYFGALIMITTALCLISPLIVKFFVGDEFSGSQQYIVWFAFGFSFYGMYSLVANYVLYSQRTIYLSYITFIVGLIHVGLSYFMITINGALGAAQAYFIISLLAFVFAWWMSNRLYPMPWFNYKMILKL